CDCAVHQMGQVLHPSCSMHLGDDTVRNCRWGGKIFRQARNISAHLKLIFLARRKRETESYESQRRAAPVTSPLRRKSHIAATNGRLAPCAVKRHKSPMLDPLH